MGIKGLFPVMKEHAPSGLGVVKFEDLRGQAIAVDVSIFVHKFVKAAGDESWLCTFMHFLCSLRRARIQAVCVFDGPNPPPEKALEHAKRKAESERGAKNLAALERLLETARALGESGEAFSDEDADEVRDLLRFTPMKIPLDFSAPHTVAATLAQVVERRRRHMAPVTREHTKLAADVAGRVLGLPCIHADGEAETVCAWLAREKFVCGVLTEDTDVLAYATPLMFALKDLKMADRKFHVIDHAKVCEEMGFTPAQFTDLCILLSGDYNERAKGWLPSSQSSPGAARAKARGIGEKGAVELMQECGSLEKCKDFLEDMSVLNFQRCRDIFSFSDVGRTSAPDPVREVDPNALREFIDRHNVFIDPEFVEGVFASSTTIVSAEEDGTDEVEVEDDGGAGICGDFDDDDDNDDNDDDQDEEADDNDDDNDGVGAGAGKEEADGPADDGSADDRSADDGSADDGPADEDGSADDGSADDGSADGEVW
jgi:5'-3' exonuclease